MTSVYSSDDGHIARTMTRHAVHQVLRAAHDNALAERPIGPGLSVSVFEPADWVRGIQAARRVASSATDLMHDYVRKARGEGTSWRDLAQPLGIEAGESDDPAERAFELVAGEPLRPFDSLTVRWRCGSCNCFVSDRGPYNGHPTDNEHGHDESCARHAAEIRAYRARHEDDDEGL